MPGWPGVTFRTELPEVVRKELEHFSAALRAHLTTQGGGGGSTNTDPLQPVPGGAYDLDYLGDYTPRVYNDGDIVIGPDGIAYVCVKDGVTTAPEPWPGVGMASAVGPPGPMGPSGPPGPAGTEVVDATYWVSSAHPTLLAERNIGALANGYVKHTSGNPYTVAVIPIAEGGTSATDAATARTNLGIGTMGTQNANAVAITGGTITVDDLRSNGNLYVGSAITHVVDVTVTRNLSVAGILGAADLRSSGPLIVAGPTNLADTTVNGNMSITGLVGAADFYGGGANLTNLNASQLTSGIVPTARLGSGAASAATFLRGDQTWAPAPGVPAGLIAIFTSACPLGWSRVAALDNRFPLGGAAWGGAGGSSTHAHTASGTTSDSGAHRHYLALTRSFSGVTGEANVTSPVSVNRSGPDLLLFLPHSHPFSGSVFVEGDTAESGVHAHAVSLATDAQSQIPPYLTVVFCQKD